jgi:hypothetical protein
MMEIGPVGGAAASSSLLLALEANKPAITPEPIARLMGKKNASDSPTPSVSAPIMVFAPIATIELNRLSLETAQAVDTPGM